MSWQVSDLWDHWWDESAIHLTWKHTSYLSPTLSPMRYVVTNFSCGDFAVRFVACRLAIIPIKSITTTWNTLFCCKICLVANYACLYREKLNRRLPMCKYEVCLEAQNIIHWNLIEAHSMQIKFRLKILCNDGNWSMPIHWKLSEVQNHIKFKSIFAHNDIHRKLRFAILGKYFLNYFL